MGKKEKIRISKNSLKDYMPIFFIIGILPIITIIHYSENSYGNFPWSNSGEILDLFLWGKNIGLLLILALIVINTIWNVTHKNWFLNIHDYMYWIIGYAVLAVLSTLFSKYKEICLFGGSEQYESLPILLAYVMICVYSYYLIDFAKISDIKNSNWYKIIFLLLLVPTLLLCLSQFFQHDLLKVLFKNENLEFMFQPGTVFGSFYNPNFVGSYVVLLLPLSLLLIIALKKWTYKILAAVISIALFFSLLGSHSTSGFIIFAIVLVIFGVMQIDTRKSAVKVGLVIVSLIAVFFVTDTTYNHYYSNKILGAFHSVTEPSNLESIQTNDDNIEIVYKNNILKVAFTYDATLTNPYSFYITDSENQNVEGTLSSDDGKIVLTDQRFENFQIYPVYLSNVNNLLAFYVIIDDKQWLFTNQTDGTYYYINNLGNLDKIDNAPIALFSKYSSFASGRGFLWGKTIPLLKKCIFLGSGPDTYAVVYPQSDYVGKYNNGYEGTYVTRPHNMYLQIWVQTGLLSLICILVFYGIYLVQSLSLYRHFQKDNFLWIAGCGIFYGTLGYMLIGFFNDSTITVAPLFWCLLGMGMAVNKKIKTTGTVSSFE